MRINVYSQELTKEVKLVSKTSENGTIHFGVRIYFDGSPRLHNRPDDDDRSAITYWIPNGEHFGPEDLLYVFEEAARLIGSLCRDNDDSEKVDLSQDVQAPPSERSA